MQKTVLQGAMGDDQQYQEFGYFPIAEERVLQVPQPRWDAEVNKPGILAGKSAKESYTQAKQARADVVRSAFDAYQRKELEWPPGYIGASDYAKKEWRRLDAVAAEESSVPSCVSGACRSSDRRPHHADAQIRSRFSRWIRRDSWTIDAPE